MPDGTPIGENIHSRFFQENSSTRGCANRSVPESHDLAWLTYPYESEPPAAKLPKCTPMTKASTATAGSATGAAFATHPMSHRPSISRSAREYFQKYHPPSASPMSSGRSGCLEESRMGPSIQPTPPLK